MRISSKINELRLQVADESLIESHFERMRHFPAPEPHHS